MTVQELSNKIGVDEQTLSEFESTATIRYTKVLIRIEQFLVNTGWEYSKHADDNFIPKRSKVNAPPRYTTPIGKPETIGDHIALRRKELKLTQEEAMKIIGVKSVSTFRRWEKNLAAPSICYYPEIMNYLGYCPNKIRT